MLSHGQTVHFRPHSVIYHLKAMHHSFKMSYLEPILVHPVRRQNFGDGVAQTCNPHLIPCLMDGDAKGKQAFGITKFTTAMTLIFLKRAALC